MSYTIVFAEESFLDIQDAFVWYELQSSGLGIRFEKTIEDSVVVLKKNPLLFQVRYSNIRILFLPVFPYGLHYYIEEKIIIVVGVFHHSISPKNWENRIKN